ncbi:hypothetical protein ANN_08128 [Periplaneta americana]|uniref:Uncharacterized protein n=1 Tax=Periplaneta americana TaxID=6978 RepID=A0ABQ8T264_PERAM|nr:hypothetical protein ANN_08128 [Periplaneta americana]
MRISLKDVSVLSECVTQMEAPYGAQNSSGCNGLRRVHQLCETCGDGVMDVTNGAFVGETIQRRSNVM